MEKLDGMNKRLPLAVGFIFIMFINSVPLIKAQSASNITINPDGSVTGTNAIIKSGNAYTFIANITGNIEVQTSNIIINGSGYTLNGNGGLGIDLDDPNSYPTITVSKVTIENLYITNCGFGILSNGGTNFTFYDDYLSNCKLDADIMLIGSSYNNITYCTLIGSNLNPTGAIGMVEGADFNIITENNLSPYIDISYAINETIERNYWGNYSTSDDNHPLMNPVAIPLTSLSVIPSPTPSATLSPTPAIPEFPTLAIVPLLLSAFSAAIVLRHRKTLPHFFITLLIARANSLTAKAHGIRYRTEGGLL